MIRTATKPETMPGFGSSQKPAGMIPHKQDHADGLCRSFLTTERSPALPYSQDVSMEKTITQPSHADEAETFEVISIDVELPPGSSFTVRPGPIGFLDLGLFSIGERLVIGRWLPDPEEGDSILQPRRLIHITGRVPFRIIGAIVPDPEMADWPSVEISI